MSARKNRTDQRSVPAQSEFLTGSVRNPAVFIGAVILLVILNLLVWVWLAPWHSLTEWAGAIQSRQMLEAEHNRLQQVIDAPCNSVVVDDYAVERNRTASGSSSSGRSATPSRDSYAGQFHTGSSQLSYAALVSLLQNSTVRVVTTNSTGSGFFINDQTIITNRHVIEDGLRGPVYVTSKALGTNPIQARVVAVSQDGVIGEPDFAILQLPEPSTTITPLRIGTDPSPLDEVISAGFPGLLTGIDLDLITPSPIFGSGRVKTVKVQSGGVSLIFHTADISSGSSGGPLVNVCGQVVGVNTFMIADENHIDGRALSALSAGTLADFLAAHPVEYQAANEVCGDQ